MYSLCHSVQQCINVQATKGFVPTAFLGRVMGELAYHLVKRTDADIALNPVTRDDVTIANATIPPPMIAGNWESLHDRCESSESPIAFRVQPYILCVSGCRCLIGNALTQAVTKHDGFEWINESKTPRPKWGWVATQVGCLLQLRRAPCT